MSDLTSFLKINRLKFCPVVPFKKGTDLLAELDFSKENSTFPPSLFANTEAFEKAVESVLQQSGARYGYGGYAEHRSIYDTVSHFGYAKGGESRTLHLGVDIWGAAGTPVMASFGGLVHSLAFNNHLGDYGATVILSHQMEDRIFYTLYGHLALSDIDNLRKGIYLVAGETFAHFGNSTENGGWPPHLHFQVIEHIGNYEGDYPGVCRYSERMAWLANSPDPSIILQMQ